MRNEKSDYLSESGIEPTPVLPGLHPGVQITKHLKHDLEDHIEALRDMDEQRKNSGGLRNYGIKVLEEWIKPELAKIDTSWDSQGTEAERRDAAEQASRYVRVIAILYRYRRGDRDDKMLSDDLKTCFDQLIQKIDGPPFLLLKKLKTHYLSVLFAAELMQALVAAAGRPYSKPALLCYYWIIREIYTADFPGWNIGGARAAKGSMESAYVTAQCLIGVLRFIQSQKDTVQFIGYLRSYLMQMHRLENKSLPTQWVAQEKRRLKYSCYVALQQYSKALAPPFEIAALGNTIDDFIKDLDTNAVRKLKQAVENVAKAFEEAIAEVDSFRNDEDKEWQLIPPGKQRDDREMEYNRQRFGHERARLSLERGKRIATSALGFFDKHLTLEVPAILEEMQNELEKAIKGTRNILRPVESYLSYVLDHELTAAALGQNSTWEPHEMVFAAASLGILDKRWREDKRLFKSLFHLSNVISDRGRFPVGRPFHHEGLDNLHFIYPGSVIGAFAELLRCFTNTAEIDLGLVKKMLRFFDDTRVHQAVVDKDITKLENEPKDRGWFNEYDVQHRRDFKASATLAAVCGLAAINRMLDERINHMILEHFQVRRPERDIELDLDALFYPDYGLSEIPESFKKPTEQRSTTEEEPLIDESEWPEVLRPEESVAVTLQRLRAHVRRISLDKAEPCYCSVALHGPPGTGKTTLVEALAKSCGAPLLVVTPSDIIMGGEEAIERRARALFEALSLLTRMVILFDEFDPVLWRRDPNANAPRSVFTFVTPGMLPKLKDLHRWAEKRACAYALSTNLIGGLDDAAVREGRFDKKIGVYPPDPVSRAGRLLNQVDHYLEQKGVKENLKRPDDLEDRVLAVVKNTAGGGMETIGKSEWFTAPQDYKKEYTDKPGGELKPFAYLFSENAKKECKKPDREAYLKPVGEGKTAIREFIQWWWIDKWDENVKTSNALGEMDKRYPSEYQRGDLTKRLIDWMKKIKSRTTSES